MNDEIEKLTEELSKLSVKRSTIIADLQAVETKHRSIERALSKAKRNKTGIPSGFDAKGRPLLTGDNVTTLTKGRYYERIAKVVRINPDNRIDIQYNTSKKETWRAGHNLLKL